MSKIMSTGHKTITRFHDGVDGSFQIQATTDVQSTVDHAQYLHNTGRVKNPLGDHHLARIPIVALSGWAEARGLTYQRVMNDPVLFNEFLEDPANSVFRVHKGSI